MDDDKGSDDKGFLSVLGSNLAFVVSSDKPFLVFGLNLVKILLKNLQKCVLQRTVYSLFGNFV